ncbi:helix-turn-helix transcriptional regulator [Pedobacter sp. PWIIR3]
MAPILNLQVPPYVTNSLIPTETFSHYMGRVAHFEFQLSDTGQVQLNISRNCFFMLANLADNTCRLYTGSTGQHLFPFPLGPQRILLITYNLDWFFYKCSLLPELKSLVDQSYQMDGKLCCLPPIRMGKILRKAFQRVIDQEDMVKLDRLCYLFINDSVNEYHRRLKSQSATVAHNLQKAAAIAQFVLENYTTELVEDRGKMADRFMVSERQLDRLAKTAFGKPLHAQVIKYRMESGLDHLLYTKKPIYEIAELTGYREAYYFSKAFKSYFGFPPSNLSKL